MTSRKLMVAVAASALCGALWPSTSLAADTHKPVPGTPSCHGNFIGFVSSNGFNNPAQESARTGMPVQELQELVRTICG